MKKIQNIILTAFLIILTFGSCTDLEEEPIGLLAPESFFQTKDDATAALMGAYGIITCRHVYGVEYFYLCGLADDLSQPSSGTGNLSEVNRFEVPTTHPYVQNVWKFVYYAISACNNVINGTPKIDASDEIKEGLIAEARALRSHLYFILVRLFGDVPYIGEFVTDPNAVSGMTRTPVNEIYQHIIEDLEYAVEGDRLPDEHAKGIRSRISKGTAYTMLADVNLTLGNWQKAAESAEYVIEHKDDYSYELSSDFKYLFYADLPDQDEFIWVVDFLHDYGNYPWNFDMFSNVCGVSGADQNGWSTLSTTVEALNSFDDRDYRKNITFCTEFKFGGELKPYTEFPTPLPHIYKYFIAIGEEGEGGYDTDANVIVYRYAEVLLMAAEALNEVNNGPTQKAYEYINEVRARARRNSNYPADLSGLSYEEFKDAVIEERRVELAHEHKRWFDISRHNLYEEVFTGSNSTEPHDHWKKLFPIPQVEIDNNPNLTQNDEY